MGRPRKPQALKELEGAFEKHPERRAAGASEPKGTGALGGPPADFLIKEPGIGYQHAAKLLAIWDQVMEEIPAGLVTLSDRALVGSYCRLRLKDNQNAIKLGEQNRMDRLARDLGLTPRGRANLSVPLSTPGQMAKTETEPHGEEESDPFAQLAAEDRRGTGERPN